MLDDFHKSKCLQITKSHPTLKILWPFWCHLRCHLSCHLWCHLWCHASSTSAVLPPLSSAIKLWSSSKTNQGRKPKTGHCNPKTVRKEKRAKNTKPSDPSSVQTIQTTPGHVLCSWQKSRRMRHHTFIKHAIMRYFLLHCVKEICFDPLQ